MTLEEAFQLCDRALNAKLERPEAKSTLQEHVAKIGIGESKTDAKLAKRIHGLVARLALLQDENNEFADFYCDLLYINCDKPIHNDAYTYLNKLRWAFKGVQTDNFEAPYS